MYRFVIMVCLLILFSLATERAQAQEPGGSETPSSTPEATTAPTPRATITPVITARPQIAITEPISGQALQGKLAIIGTSAVNGFQLAELAFSYTGDPTDTWFLIAATTVPVSAGPLAEWDTTQISDGEYDVRLLVMMADGTQISAIVPAVRVRNYTAIETDTPTPITPTSASEQAEPPSGTSTLTRQPPTATPLPPNPAQVSNRDLAVSFGQGALFTLGAFALGGLYISLRKIRSKR